MGIIFGKTGTQEPSFILLSKLAKTPSYNYQVRSYEPYLIAEVEKLPGKEGDGFRTLAKYIGVFGKPENEGSVPMAMTSPVIGEPTKLSMTSPVVDEMGSMSFVLPFSFTKIDQLPVPIDKRISLKEIPRRILAVVSFSGWYSQAEGNKQLNKLKTWLESDKLIPEGSINDANSVKWSVAQYHPPFTLPFLRRNEIWIELDEKNEAIKKALMDNTEAVDGNKK
mmetsp:Transcript_25673/g.24531  ORF Transcript_25673/g.24531 Transcript_25673/m.24531 type:complete len:223 (-) Transcript_25673:317-985(-)|eukprot:CAMPEP_0119041334 /NCGR_PEP_ID=MMETSP1177-20130426/11565_1 /TAXON_ID=2985 /ORGANISM="Ochromonas sp, Strain CCMP1899" /LENGTH=222 /DNA_ID=CAMNT_0007007301 /DNA_START=112 /DNA_END=780 /DNA_ORIENTATION=-